jgi:hypothetical protein
VEARFDSNRLIFTVGNRRFRVLISLNLEKYSRATTRTGKPRIVTEIVDIVRESSGNGGGFIRKHTHRDKWFEVGICLAREKVGQAIRGELRKRRPVKWKKVRELTNSVSWKANVTDETNSETSA